MFARVLEIPVYLAAFHNRLDALKLLQKKGVNINLVKNYLGLWNEDDWTNRIYRSLKDDSHKDRNMDGLRDPKNGLIHHPDL